MPPSRASIASAPPLSEGLPSAAPAVAAAAAGAVAPRHRHSTWTIALHWASVAAIAVAAVAALWRNAVEADALRGVLLEVHRQAGLFVLLALAVRLAVRWRHPLANHAGAMSRLLHLAAQGAHLALYAALLLLPLVGWAVSNAHAVTVKLFGILPLPMLVADDPDLADKLTDWHSWGAWALLALVTAHIGAAIWHHAIRRDNVLLAMLPLARRRKNRPIA